MNILIEEIERLPAVTPRERGVQKRFLDLIRTEPDCFLRSNLKAHITASAFVIDRSAARILLIYHKKLEKWLQPGGHCDGEQNTLAVAIREVFEETGVVIQADNQPIIDLDIHTIPPRREVPEHEHFDVRYLFEADSALPLIRNHETLALEWVSWNDLPQYTEEASVLRILHKISPMPI